MDKSFMFKADGPGIPATGTIAIYQIDPARSEGQVVGNQGEAAVLAQWFYDHATVATSMALRDALNKLLEGRT